METMESLSDREIGVAEMTVSNARGDRLVTHSLGSCLGVCVHDPVAGVGGLLHVMLPSSDVDPQKAQNNPFIFVDTGVPELFRAVYRAGAQKDRLIVKVVGGCVTGEGDQQDAFQVGQRNVRTLRKLLWKTGVTLRAEDVGGRGLSRAVFMQVGSGEVIVKTNGSQRNL